MSIKGVGDVTNENKAYIVIIVLAAALAYVLFGGNSDSGRLDAIRSDIQRVADQQRNIDARLDKISTGLDRGVKTTETISARIAGVEGTLDAVAGRIDSGKSRIEASARLIDEGQQRVESIRQRAEKSTGPAQN